MGKGVGPVTVRMLLVRHGESEWNRSSRYAGQQDVPLSALGREQARRIARRLAGESITGIYASPLQRARETASIIGQRVNVPVMLEPGFSEIHHGAWEGLTTVEVGSEFPDEYARWRVEPHTVEMPGGETLADVAGRSQATLARIIERQCDGLFVICAHDAILRVLVLRCLGLGLEHFWKWSFENASLSILESCDDERQTFRLVCLNDTTHLDGVCSESKLQAL